MNELVKIGYLDYYADNIYGLMPVQMLGLLLKTLLFTKAPYSLLSLG